MLDFLISPKLIVVYVWLAFALLVHFRGRARLPFYKQLFDHSTFLAPYNCLVYLFSGVANRPVLEAADFPQLATLRDMESDGLLAISDSEIEVLHRGRPFLRNICMPFDAYLQPDAAAPSDARFSATV